MIKKRSTYVSNIWDLLDGILVHASQMVEMTIPARDSSIAVSSWISNLSFSGVQLKHLSSFPIEERPQHSIPIRTICELNAAINLMKSGLVKPEVSVEQVGTDLR